MVIFVMLTLLLNIILTVFVRKREYLKKPLNLCITMALIIQFAYFDKKYCVWC